MYNPAQTNSDTLINRGIVQTLLRGLFCLMVFAPHWVQAEGTEQTTATASDRTHLLTNFSEYNDFARYNGNIDQRLFIHIEDPENEVVYLGFSQFVDQPHWPNVGSSITGYFRIKDPSGTVVWPTQGNPNGQLNNAAIAGWAEAVTVTNSFGCVGISNDFEVTQNPLPEVSIEADGPTTVCEGTSAVLTAVGNSPYLWNTLQTTQSISVLFEGTYFVQVTDTVTGCSAISNEITIEHYPLFIPAIDADGPTSFCAGDEVTLTVVEGSGFLWSTGDTTQSITVTTSGVYTVIAIDQNGCSGFAGQTVTVLPTPPAAIVPDFDFPYCDGDVVVLTATGIPFVNTFEWNTGETSQAIEVTQNGIYTVTISNVFGCSAEASFPIFFLPTPTAEITINGSTSLCEGDEVTLTASGIPFINNFLWSTGQTSPSITISEPGSYTVTVSSQAGCSATSEPVVIIVVPGPTADAGADVIICIGDTATLSASGGQNIVWTPGGSTPSIDVSPLDDTMYTVEVTNDGCDQMAVDTVWVITQDYPTADFGHGNPNFGEPIEFSDSSTVPPLFSWNWDFGDGTGSDEQNPAHDYQEAGEYIVTLIVSTANGCMDTISDTLDVQEFFIITNVLTPNGDEKNDYVWIHSSLTDMIDAKVYNRWGLSVWEGIGNDLRFTGQTSAGVDLPAGTYYYVIKLDYGDAETTDLTGYITLIR